MGAEAAAGRLGIGRDVLLDPSVMRVVPRDATYVAAFAYDFGGVPGVIRSALRAAGAPMEELEEEQGFRTAMGFVDSLSAALGEDVVIYRSMSTGGGGPLSGVASVGVADEASMERWLDRLAGLASGAGAQFLRGYAHVRKHEIEGATAWSLRSVGVPLPVDVTMALGDGRLTVGATSGAVRAAVLQLGGEGLSVRENPSFRRSMGPAMGGGVELIALQWRDMGWHAERAYGVAELFGAAVENGVRQRYGGPREVGDVVPGFAEFTADVEPSAGWSYWDGEDLVSYVESDGSVLVNLSVGAKEAIDQQLVAAVPTLLGSSLPALAEARGSARRAQSATQVRFLVQCGVVAQMDTGGLPGTLEELREFGFEETSSPFGPAPDGGPDFAVREIADAEDGLFSGTTVYAIDRAMYLDRSLDFVNVGFADGRVELLTRAELRRVLERETNRGALGDWGLE